MSLAGAFIASLMLSLLLSRKWTLYLFVLGAEDLALWDRSLSTSRNRELSSSWLCGCACLTVGAGRWGGCWEGAVGEV